jgi:hypothetical protein
MLNAILGRLAKVLNQRMYVTEAHGSQKAQQGKRLDHGYPEN